MINGSPITADKVVTLKRGSQVSASGWAADGATNKAAENIYVVIVHPEGAVLYAAKPGNRLNRQDIPSYNAAGLGFEARGDSSVIRPGSYHVVVLSQHQRAFKMCDRGGKVQVGE